MSEHKMEDLKGRVKKAAGELLGDGHLKREGEIDQASAAAKKTIDIAADKLNDALNGEQS